MVEEIVFKKEVKTLGNSLGFSFSKEERSVYEIKPGMVATLKVIWEKKK